ncbi:uncharacterized protein LOC115402445 [Salarias fasciatus]|uniref:uncharacterized protein LOC115402445 n=1 Tax=Salarias fasciatus TaxID=181472 RepID=UPI0011769CAD|nr:uncharacterized protein LOC115402445 [Salarias fasciatus]
MFLFHLFVLQSAVAAVVQRAGEDVTLTCQHELEGQRDCNGTSWYYDYSRSSVELVQLGKIKNNSEIEPDRLRVTADCSLMIKKVTVQDVGLYYCGQDDIISHSSGAYLSVVTIVTEQKVDDEETLKCFVTPSEENCELEVKWKIKDQDIDEVNSQIKTEKNGCSATVTLKKSHYLHPQSHFLSCEVTDWTGEKFCFSPRPSGDTKSTVKPETLSKSTTTGTSGASADPQGLSRNLAVSLGLAALVICVVTVNMWARIKEEQIQRDGTTEVYLTQRCLQTRREEDEAAVTYENLGETSVSVRLH